MGAIYRENRYLTITVTQANYMINNYPKKTFVQIAKEMNVSYASLYNNARLLGLIKKRDDNNAHKITQVNITLNDNEVQAVKNNYPAKSFVEIAKMLNVKYDRLYKNANLLGLVKGRSSRPASDVAEGCFDVVEFAKAYSW